MYGLSLAKGLILGGMAKNVLLITSETYSKFIHVKDKSNKTIFGDAASATLITDQPGKFIIGDFIFGTDGKGAENLIVKNGGVRNLNKKSDDHIDEYGNIHNDNNLFNFTSEAIPNLKKQILFKLGLELNDIDLFVFHQANKYMLNHIRKKIGIPEEKFFISMEHCGNTVSSTIPIALHDAMQLGKLDLISNCLLEGFGVGYSWAACYLKITK